MQPHLTVPERFWSKVEFTDSCWLWTAAKSGGYGHFWPAGRMIPAHRWAYEFCVGPIPEGLEIDHLCRVRACVNPSHLEPVSPTVNKLRGFGLPAKNARKTHCPQGHPYSGENLILLGTWRYCRICSNKFGREKKRRLRAKAKGSNSQVWVPNG